MYTIVFHENVLWFYNEISLKGSQVSLDENTLQVINENIASEITPMLLSTHMNIVPDWNGTTLTNVPTADETLPKANYINIIESSLTWFQNIGAQSL